MVSDLSGSGAVSGHPSESSNPLTVSAWVGQASASSDIPSLSESATGTASLLFTRMSSSESLTRMSSFGLFSLSII